MTILGREQPANLQAWLHAQDWLRHSKFALVVVQLGLLTLVVQTATQAGFTVLDLSDVYRNQEISDLIVAPFDFHPNAHGHRLIAERLYELLQDRDLIDLVAKPHN